MKHLDLFSGIGGFALAARWAGIETVQFVEIDPFCQKVLAKNFPGVPIHDNIRTFTYAPQELFHGRRTPRKEGREKCSNEQSDMPKIVRDTINNPFLLTGGFPCQPFSCAGKRRGKEDDRFLWPEMLRVVSEAKPDWVIGENVAGFINMGLDDCISDLENQGYEVQVFVIPACAVGAPHRRDRVWIVANLRGIGCAAGRSSLPGQESGAAFPCNTDRHASHAESRETQPTEPGGLHTESCGTDRVIGNSKCTPTESIPPAGRSWHTVSESNRWNEPWLEAATRLCRVDDGLPRQMDRVNRLKALGNAIVPQVAYEIMKAILEKG